MKIGYINRKMEKNCRAARTNWGDKIGGKILLRLAELAAFENLSHVPHVPPQRCHMLKDSNLKFAVDVSPNYRLIFSPAPPYEYKEGVGLVKESVKAILIEEVADYH
jgi:proteic killer suppression protein